MGKKDKSDAPGAQRRVWEDREIRFDSPAKALTPRRGEYIIDSINSVEDTKGNNGERGSLIATNLRIIWASHRHSTTNLSIGYNTILTMGIRKAKSKLRGNHLALYLMTKFGASRFEFIFTSLVKSSPRIFSTSQVPCFALLSLLVVVLCRVLWCVLVTMAGGGGRCGNQSVLRAYETSKLYRDLKLRGSLIRDGALVMLPKENVLNCVQGVWNLSYDQGNLGTLIITNIRVVWHANLATNYNVSVPYMQINSIRVRASKFGDALVLETSPTSGGYMLGFRITPGDVLDTVVKELTSLYNVYSVEPIFGVDFKMEEKPASVASVKASRVNDDIQIIDTQQAGGISYPAYLADTNKKEDREVVFDPHLGLAIESTAHQAVTTTTLWEVAPNSDPKKVVRKPSGPGV